LEKQADLLASLLVEQNQDIIVLSSTTKLANARWDRQGPFPVRYFWTYHSPQVSGRYLPASLIWAVQLFVWICLNHHRIDVLHCHQIRIHSFVACLANRLFGIPVIQKSATGGDGADIKAIGSHKYFGAAGRRFIIRYSTTFIATTESISADLLRWGVPEAKIRVIPNGLVLPAPSETATPEVRVGSFIYAGRIAGDKNVLLLADAAAQAFAGCSAHLEIYGDGPEAGLLKERLDRVPSPNVAYFGFRQDIGAVFPGTGYLVLPSNAEGLSNAMLEAMVNGVVPVVTRVSGCVDHVVEGETGYFIDTLSLDYLTQKLEFIAHRSVDIWQNMSKACSAYARSRFDINNVAKDYVALYAALTDGRASQGGGA
jgi:glycosyltransferase involved in cell wall biosynthesis